MMLSSNVDSSLHSVDYDLHGIVGIRLENVTQKDADIVTRQLGPVQKSLGRNPDIVIRFVNQLTTPNNLRFLGVDDAGFTDDAFYILRSKHKSRVKVLIPFEQVGQKCEIVCERGLPAVPLLIPILNLTMLGKGLLPIHASAFIHKGCGILVTGWAKGGKTETLLAFTSNGAQYVGDEWIYLGMDDNRMRGIPEPIRVWDWQLRDLPHYRSRVSRKDLVRLNGLHFVVEFLERLSDGEMWQNGSLMRSVRRITPLLKKQQYVHLKPDTLFGRNGSSLSGTLDTVLFAMSHESSDIQVEPIDPLEIANRMVYSIQEERMDLLSYYLKFRFAFPKSNNELLEKAEDLQRRALQQILSGKRAYQILHPYPVSIPALFDAIEPIFTA